MKIVVASGKGGVGKSMLASSLAVLFSKERRVVAVDCDVDAPNLGLWLGVPEPETREKISTSVKASINPEKCIHCKKCYVCRFKAISDFKVDPLFCEGCGVCELVCPAGAVSLTPVLNGTAMTARTKFGFPLVYGQVTPGETGSGKVVTEIRKRADRIECDVQILDSAAGIGCPVIASVRDTDFAVLITEPSVSGFSDIQRALEVIDHFSIPHGVVINQWDINPEMSERIETWAGSSMLGKISYDRKVVDAIVNLTPVVLTDSKTVKDIEQIYKRLR